MIPTLIPSPTPASEILLVLTLAFETVQMLIPTVVVFKVFMSGMHFQASVSMQDQKLLQTVAPSD